MAIAVVGITVLVVFIPFTRKNAVDREAFSRPAA